MMTSQAAPKHNYTQHFITTSLAGGAVVGMSGNETVKPALGGEGQFALSYELLNHGFFFSFGVGADYRLTRYNLQEDMVDAFPRQDRDGYDVIYRYCYSRYTERQQTVSATVPVWLGYRVKDKVYFAAGAKLSVPLWNNYSTKTNMYTEGQYVNLIEFVSRDVPSYGYYPSVEYTYKGSYTAPNLVVSPMIEIGGFFRIIPRFSCRLGAYVEYAIPVMGSGKTMPLIDYSAIDINPQTQNRENLEANIRFNSVLDSRLSAAKISNLSFGIRATFRINVTQHTNVCMCESDN